jgi:hypothetical protein
LQMITAVSPTFLRWVLLIDEACFTWIETLNTRNQHTLADENPHSFQELWFQQQLAINVWAGIMCSLLYLMCTHTSKATT